MSQKNTLARRVFRQIIRIIPIFAGAVVGYQIGQVIAGLLLYGLRDGDVQRAETFVFWTILSGSFGSVAGIIFSEIVLNCIRERARKKDQT